MVFLNTWRDENILTHVSNIGIHTAWHVLKPNNRPSGEGNAPPLPSASPPLGRGPTDLISLSAIAKYTAYCLLLTAHCQLTQEKTPSSPEEGVNGTLAAIYFQRSPLTCPPCPVHRRRYSSHTRQFFWLPFLALCSFSDFSNGLSLAPGYSVGTAPAFTGFSFQSFI